MDAIWVSFFNATFEVGEGAMAKGLITTDDCLECEPFLFIGLPASTVLEAVLRSTLLSRPAIQLAVGGAMIDETNCPPQHRAMFLHMLEIRKTVQEQKLTVPEIEALRHITIFGDAERPAHPLLARDTTKAKELSVRLHRVVGRLNTMAIYISQQAFYKEQFQNILQLLGSLK